MNKKMWSGIRFRPLRLFFIWFLICCTTFGSAQLALSTAASTQRGLTQLRLSSGGISAEQLDSAISQRRDDEAEEMASGTTGGGAAASDKGVEPPGGDAEPSAKGVETTGEDAEPSAKGGTPLGGRNAVAYTAWSRLTGLVAEEPALERSAKVAVVYYFGENSLRFRLSEGACSIPKEVAFQLWGTEDAVGNELEIQGVAYRVEQVNAEGDVVAHLERTQAFREELPAFRNLELWVGDGADSGDRVGFDDRVGFGTRAGTRDALAGDAQLSRLLRFCPVDVRLTLRCDELLGILNAWLKLPFWVLTVWLLVKLRRACGVYREDGANPERKRVVYWLIGKMKVSENEDIYNAAEVMDRFFHSRVCGTLWMTGLAALLLWILWATVGLPVWFPERFLPTVWSDLSFWTHTLEDVWRGCTEYLSQESSWLDVPFRRAMWQALVGSPLAAVAAVMAARQLSGGQLSDGQLDQGRSLDGRRLKQRNK